MSRQSSYLCCISYDAAERTGSWITRKSLFFSVCTSFPQLSGIYFLIENHMQGGLSIQLCTEHKNKELLNWR